MKKLLLTFITFILFPAPILPIDTWNLKDTLLAYSSPEERHEILTARKRYQFVGAPFWSEENAFYRSMQTNVPQATIPAGATINQADIDDALEHSMRAVRNMRENHKTESSAINFSSGFICGYVALIAKLISITPQHPDQLLSKAALRMCRALTGAVKITPWLALYTFLRFNTFENKNDSSTLYFNGPKLLSLYMAFDMAHKYGTDIIAKKFPSINKYDKALRERIKRYDTLKDKLGWLAKASFAAYQSRVYL